MTDLEPSIQKEYDRYISDMEEFMEPHGQHIISMHEVLNAHFQIANHFYIEGNGLGGVGPKDLGLLHSAIFRQVVEFNGKVKWNTIFEVCATLLFGLIKNHPFYDANKRTAFLCAVFQLQKNGWCLSVPGNKFEDFMVEIADNKLLKYKRYAESIKKGESDPEIKYIAWFMRHNTRRIDKNDYTVTYNQLQVILRKYGFDLKNPHNNYIDIIGTRKKGRILGVFGAGDYEEVKIGQIGFPRWTAEVGKGALKTVREVTKLTSSQGVDSASFFHGVDSMQSLIGMYQQPLINLANR